MVYALVRGMQHTGMHYCYHLCLSIYRVKVILKIIPSIADVVHVHEPHTSTEAVSKHFIGQRGR